MECDQVRDELVKFIDNEVSDEIRRAVEAHLENCAECSKELESLRSVLGLCHRWRDISPSRNWEMEFRRKLTRSRSGPTTELEMLKSAVIGLSRRVQELEESRAFLPPTLESEIMTVDELARYLRLSKEQVYEIIDQLPKFQIGYEYRFRRESIDQWVRSLEQQSYPQDYLWGNWYTKEE